MAQRRLCIFDTTLNELAGHFNPKAKLKPVEIPAELYEEFLRLYHRSERLYEKLLMVLCDGEHQLIMEEGRGRFNLPPDDYLKEDLRDLRRCLKGFNPYKVVERRNGKVKLTAEQVDSFFTLFAKDYDVFHNVAEAVRHTDYLDYHRYLRDVRKVKYAGPTSLREVVQVFFGIARAQHKQAAYLTELGASPG